MGSIMTPRKAASRFFVSNGDLRGDCGKSLVALTKFGAATWTGSSAMLSEGIHSVVDRETRFCFSTVCAAATARPDREHPWLWPERSISGLRRRASGFAVGAGLSF